jgi:hypothetical protein
LLVTNVDERAFCFLMKGPGQPVLACGGHVESTGLEDDQGGAVIHQLTPGHLPSGAGAIIAAGSLQFSSASVVRRRSSRAVTKASI